MDNYVVLARKYRPPTFSDVKGQEHVTRSLGNAIKRNKIGQAYLFTGPRGVGKTSIARILAKSLNCEKGSTAEPCLKCTNCKEITQGTSLSVWEIDGASHNSVDNVRELIDSFRSLPPPGYRFKLYIIDEVHMLSIAAFNALLKSLEEPPPHTVFILATTEVHKIPETVLSRCQRFDLRALTNTQIEEQLKILVEKEKIRIQSEAIRLIARAADGSLRDAETLLDRVQNFSEGEITAEDTSMVLGTVSRAILFSLTQAILGHDADKVLLLLSDIFTSGADEAAFIRELVAHFREVFLSKLAKESDLKGLGVGEDEIVTLVRITSPHSLDDIQDLYKIIRDGCDAALRTNHTKLALEALLVRAALRKPLGELSALLGALKTGAQSTTAISSVPTSSAGAPVSRTVSASQDISTPRQIPNPAKPPATPLEWDEFLVFVAQNGGKLLAEQLKKLTTTQFLPGLLDLSGPEFSLGTVKREGERIRDLLIKYCESVGIKTSVWKIDTQAKAQETKEAETLEHPAIKSLQKVFPGSKVEGIKEH